MSLDLGCVAYDAYRLRRGGVAYDGTAIPEWDALRPEIREAWGDAAAAVIGARSPQPAGTIDLDAARKTAREAQYDEHISPLMKQIIALCKTHDIPFVALFELTDDRQDPDVKRRICRTCIAPQKDACSMIEAARAAVYPPNPSFVALTIRSGEAR